MQEMKSNIKNTPQTFAVVDLFCGVGGLTQGFVKAKFDVRAGIDFDASCKYAYEKNNSTSFIHSDLTKTSPTEIAKLYPDNSIKFLQGVPHVKLFQHTSKAIKQMTSGNYFTHSEK